jgi:hypothetical protein
MRDETPSILLVLIELVFPEMLGQFRFFMVYSASDPWNSAQRVKHKYEQIVLQTEPVDKGRSLKNQAGIAWVHQP